MASPRTERLCFVVVVSGLLTLLVLQRQLLLQQCRPWARESDATGTTPFVNSLSPSQTPSPANSTTAATFELHDRKGTFLGKNDDMTRAVQGLAEMALREWGYNNTTRMPKSATSTPPDGCTDLLQHYDLCEPVLLRVPEQRLAYTAEKPFVFLHFSKCAGTSLISKLAYMGYISFSLRLPPTFSTASACGTGISAKCCWWRERLHNFSANGQRPKILQQEPANDDYWINKTQLVHEVDPGFDVTTDFCPDDFAYLTVLRPPIQRVHSHMCEVGENFKMWQKPNVTSRKRFITKQLRDNYYVRSLGGAEAWNAPEGGLRKHHLLAAARALARFDVVMTVATITGDAPAQMGHVGLPGFKWQHYFSRSRKENLQRAKEDPLLRTSGVASCEVPPTGEELHHLVAACAWDAVLYEFASVLAARRTEAARIKKNHSKMD